MSPTKFDFEALETLIDDQLEGITLKPRPEFIPSKTEISTTLTPEQAHDAAKEVTNLVLSHINELLPDLT